MRAGFRDVLASPMTVEALADATARGATWAQAVRERSEADDLARVAEHIGGRIIAVAGAKGGVGCSTVALHVALAAAGHDSERPVCLAELDLQTGDLRSLLDLQSHRSIADLASVAEGEVTVRSLDDTLYVHTTGLRVLLAPERGEDGEDISASAARQILGALKFQYDIVICDVGSVMTEAGAVAVEMASTVLIVTTPDVPAIRAANRLLRLWERLQIDTPARILLNRTSREHEIQPDFARRVLQAPVLDATLPSGFRDLEEALNTGHPERLEQGSIHRALAEVAVAVEAVPAEGRRRRLRLRRAARAATGQTTVEMLGMLPDHLRRDPRPHPDAVRRLHVDGDQPGRARRGAGVGRRRQQGLVDRRGQGRSSPRAGATTPRSPSSRTAASRSPSRCPRCCRCPRASRRS